MSKQITVRLPDELVEFMDRLVDDNKASSRASVVARAMERERRRELAERDAAILEAHSLAAREDPDDLDGLAVTAGGTVLTDLD
ncbi:ribbon-helix-helix domain-containing protein [Kribbella sp. CA-293567]|uniref:ribbon-helix-helix domain-containing protein n=1 Tax=Kribbella sp. CA-293567 TaxID=3002436 RepID=UPI0022DDD5C2|nr:ribbon-helix-helix domain-containing protein [Kribbella sp. CA-293567]WBQ02563.1 ribbon-helix-helix domain-containing protein [Kribbella sp. CA-293567]